MISHYDIFTTKKRRITNYKLQITKRRWVAWANLFARVPSRDREGAENYKLRNDNLLVLESILAPVCSVTSCGRHKVPAGDETSLYSPWCEPWVWHTHPTTKAPSGAIQNIFM